MKQTFHKDSGVINNHKTRDTELKGASSSQFLPFLTARDVKKAVTQLRVRAVTAPLCWGRADKLLGLCCVVL